MITFKIMFVTMMSTLGIHQDPSINVAQMYCMTEAIYYEAANQATTGKVAVANVIQNRAKTVKHAGDVCSVINQPKQFSYKSNNLPKLRGNHPATIDSLKNSMLVSYLALKNRLPDITGGAHYYLNPAIATDFSWQRKFTRTYVYGDHHFYKNVKES